MRLSFAGEPVLPASRKGLALLAYLCLAPTGARRDELAELLWGPGRLANLRQELYALRKLPGAETWLEEDGGTLMVHAATDVALFVQAASGGEVPGGIHVATELLPELSQLAAPAFRDWLDEERHRLSELRQLALREGAARCEAQGSFAEALSLLDSALVSDPLAEDLHRAAIRLTALQGDRAGALARFERCRTELRREAGVEPSEETLALVASLQILDLPPVARSRPELEGDLVAVLRAVVLGGGVLDVETLALVLERQALDVADDLARLEQQGWLDQHLVPDAELAVQVANGTPAGVKRLLHQRIAQALA